MKKRKIILIIYRIAMLILFTWISYGLWMAFGMVAMGKYDMNYIGYAVFVFVFSLAAAVGDILLFRRIGKESKDSGFPAFSKVIYGLPLGLVTVLFLCIALKEDGLFIFESIVPLLEMIILTCDFIMCLVLGTCCQKKQKQ